jgi:hypothetical protein
MATLPIGSAGTLEKSDYVKFLKEWYQGTVVADLVYKNHPWLGIVPKNPNVRGNVYPKPIRYANITGQSALYATAHENQGPATRNRWELSHIDNYAKATVSNKVIELSLGDPAAFRAALQDAVDSAHSAFANDVHFELVRAETTGSRATVASVAAGPPVVLTLGTGEARFFEVGMYVQHSDDSGATVEADQVYVTAVDRANDTITLSADWAGAGAVANDLVYRSGDFGAKADSLTSWLPGSAVTSALFNGIDRTADKTRLAGVDGVKGGAGTPYLSHLVLTGAALYNEGQTPNICLLNPVDHAGLAIETEARGARYAKVDSTSGKISFSALSVMTGAGEVPVVSDPAVKADTSFMGDKDEVELFSAGGVPRMFKADGSFYHREEGADTLAFYLFAFYNQCIQSPVTWAYTPDIV